MLTTCLKYDSCRLPASLCNSKCKKKEMPTTFKNLPTTLKKEKIGIKQKKRGEIYEAKKP